MKQRTIQTLFNYWDDRAGRIAPRRLEIEPARIAGILAETFVLERVNGDFQFRLAGTRLCELFGYELRGTSFLGGWIDDDRRLLERQLQVVCSEGAVAHIAIEAGIDARHRIELEAVLLPLLHTDNTISRIIGAMSPTTLPNWQEKGRLTSRRLISHELVRMDSGAEAKQLNGQRATPFLPQLTGARVVRSERRQFRVLDGGLSAGKQEKA